MKHHNTGGKYLANKPTQKRSGVSKSARILCIFFVILVLAFGVLLFFIISMNRSDRAFQDLATTVHSQTLPLPETISSTVPSVHATESTIADSPSVTDPIPEKPPEKTQILEAYAPLYEQNSDFFGWLKIDGTKIDYPVMYNPNDPEKYLHADFNGVYSYPGTPFLDISCTPDSDNLIIYAHNMYNGTMFNSLLHYQESTYWKKHPTIQFNTLYQEQEYEVLAAFYDRVYYQRESCFKFYQFIDAKDEADYENAITNFKNKSLYDTGVTASYGDKLITLVTCAYHTENGRFVVVAKKAA